MEDNNLRIVDENPVSIPVELPIQLPDGILQLKDMGLPEPDLISYYVMESKRRIYLDFDVSSDVMGFQRLITRWNMEDYGKPVEQRKPIWIYINSYGGDADYMWSIVDTILTSKTPIYTVCLGFACSAASIIFISGQQRFMMPRAKVMIHQGSAQMGGDATKVLDASESYKKLLKQMKDFILERTQIPSAALSRKKSNDWELSAEECLNYNVCDRIIESMDEIIGEEQVNVRE